MQLFVQCCCQPTHQQKKSNQEILLKNKFWKWQRKYSLHNFLKPVGALVFQKDSGLLCQTWEKKASIWLLFAFLFLDQTSRHPNIGSIGLVCSSPVFPGPWVFRNQFIVSWMHSFSQSTLKAKTCIKHTVKSTYFVFVCNIKNNNNNKYILPLHCSIHFFHQPIGLGMIRGTQAPLNAQYFAYICVNLKIVQIWTMERLRVKFTFHQFFREFK